LTSGAFTAAGTGHLQRLRAWMASQHVDAAYITRPVSVAYLTGFRSEPMERLMALAIRPEGATLIVPALEKDHAVGAVSDVEVVGAIRVGQSELEVANMITAAISGAGGTLSFEPLVQFGHHSAVPHHRPADTRLAPGDLVLLDFGAAVDGYCADTTRMAVAGEPDQLQMEIHGV